MPPSPEERTAPRDASVSRNTGERRAAPPGERRADGERSLGDLLSDLMQKTRALVRQEIALAKTELRENAARAGGGAGLLGAGAALAYAGLIVLVAALGLLLGTFMPDWLGLAIAAAAFILVGVMLLQSGRSKLQDADFSFTKTTDTLREDTQWMKEEAKEAKQGRPDAKPSRQRRDVR